YCFDNGLMQGKSATMFDPKANTTRAEFATVLYRLAGSPDVTGTNPFTDCATHWAKDAITWAYENEIVKGVSATAFDPNANVTREQLVSMLYRFCGEPEVTGDLSAYKDAASVSTYAVDAMVWAAQNGVITGRTANTLVPKGEATRAELATILHRFDEMDLT
ncbi:MAG: S-layer homology domain-containing protein, partial [Oscillospiraceae bacterium]|nr:S-layer homology domain-containing protein [Oscillospiraceae bacterium]